MTINYWLTNAGLSVLVLLGLFLLRSAPPRPKLWMCLAAVTAWCIPWPMLSSLWRSSDLFVRYVRVDQLQSLPLHSISLPPVSAAAAVPWTWILVAASALGLLVFFYRVFKDRKQQKAWMQNAEAVPDCWRQAGYPDTGIPVLAVDELDNAFVSGYRHPAVWIGRSQLASPALPSILRHELAHIRQHDNLILLFLALLADLFWWNPLVRLLVRQARRYLELSCDYVCQKSSPGYREDLAGELLNREYRALQSRLISPVFRDRNFNVYRVRQLAREISMNGRHVLLLGVFTVVSVVLVSNVAISQVVPDERQIVTHLTLEVVTTASDGSIDRRSIVTEFAGEPEVRKLLDLARTADVTLDTRMENEFRRVIKIESSDLAEVHKVMAAFEGTGMEFIRDSRAIRDTGRHIFLELGFTAADVAPFSVSLAPNIGEWTGVTVGDYLLRIRTDLSGARGQQTVLLSTEISRVEEQSFTLLATPRVATEFGKEVLVDVGESALSLTLLPRQSL